MPIIVNALLIAAGIASLLVTVFFYYHKQTAACWLTFAAVVLFALAGCLQWQKRIWESDSVVHNVPFAITIGTAFAASNRAVNDGAAWYSWYQPPPGGELISPIHWMMIVRITNRQPVRSQIETYRVEAKARDEKWTRLTWMDGESGGIYKIIDGNPKNAITLDMPKMDVILERRILAPNETVEGWVFLEYPENFIPHPDAQPFRIYVKDLGGAETVQEVNSPLGQSSEFARGAGFRSLGKADLSGARIGYYSDGLRLRQGARPN